MSRRLVNIVLHTLIRTLLRFPLSQAGVNFDSKLSRENFVKMLGSRGVESAKKAPLIKFKTHDENYESNLRIPKQFDARKKWRKCRTIGVVRDQGLCGSCWVRIICI